MAEPHCTACGQTDPARFYLSRLSRCKPCHRKDERRRYAVIRATPGLWRRRLRQTTAAARRWKQRHPEDCAAWRADYRDSGKRALAQQRRRHRQVVHILAHPEQVSRRQWLSARRTQSPAGTRYCAWNAHDVPLAQWDREGYAPQYSQQYCQRCTGEKRQTRRRRPVAAAAD